VLYGCDCAPIARRWYLTDQEAAHDERD